MLRKISAFAIFGLLTLMATEYAMTSSGGPPPNHTGAPGQSNCTACHGGTVNSGPATRTLVFNGNPNLTSYVPGQTYTAVLTINQTGIGTFGFQMIARNANNANVGTFIATNTAQTQVSSGYLQHTFGGISATTTGTKSWNFSWTAPAVGTGTVSFYVATNAADGTGGTSDDAIYTNVFTLTEAAAAPSVTAATVTQSAVCRGGSITVNFTTSANFNAGNIFTVELSDANGSFTNPTNIGTLNATAPAPITAQTPAAAAGGAGYRVRVVASNPVSTGAQSAPFTITVPAAAPNVSFDGRTLTATGTGTFAWFLNGNPIGGATTASYVPTQAGSYTAGIVNNGCSPSISTPIVVTAGISSVTSIQRDSLCPLFPIIFRFQSFGSFSGSNIFSVELVDSIGNVTVLPSAVSNDTAYGTVTSVLTGSGYRYRLRSSNPVALSPLSGPITFLPGTMRPILIANGFDLTAVVMSPAPDEIKWYRNQVLIPNASGNTYSVTQNGSYSATAVRFGCESTYSNDILITNVSVEPQDLSTFSVFPNPTTDVITVQSSASGNLEIRDLQGKLILSSLVDEGKNPIDLRALPPGVYLFSVQNLQRLQYQRIVKQ